MQIRRRWRTSAALSVRLMAGQVAVAASDAERAPGVESENISFKTGEWSARIPLKTRHPVSSATIITFSSSYQNSSSLLRFSPPFASSDVPDAPSTLASGSSSPARA
ncbi:hypothetical protein K466DRAFT_317955 [Polyporus arcularius HHB13444]|uniref:Secreted protein n=1 Tax=Polyporus arcularius HHB13444 TaxID=1314778 RepID=A0A5C3P026_9APHY|nr:hypothetical protein K466DRAFT_317955 [Polyporus arcularius HHB13444]